jgi:hypothetical protein
MSGKGGLVYTVSSTTQGIELSYQELLTNQTNHPLPPLPSTSPKISSPLLFPLLPLFARAIINTRFSAAPIGTVQSLKVSSHALSCISSDNHSRKSRGLRNALTRSESGARRMIGGIFLHHASRITVCFDAEYIFRRQPLLVRG